MTAVDLDALDAARAAATPGEWTATEPLDPRDMARVSGATGEIAQAYEPADAALIVAAVNALSHLTAALRAMEALHARAHPEGPTSCVECNKGRKFVPWPCPTVAVLAAAVTSEGERE